MKSLCLFVSLLAVVYGFEIKGPGKECTKTTQCQPGECCRIVNEFQYSKRKVAINGIMPIKRTGTCEPYKLEGDSCDIFYRTYGCSCEPGTRCRNMAAARPGYYWNSKCTKQ